MTPPRRPLIGLALGSGSARGWAHIGVLRALTEAGLKPDIVADDKLRPIFGADSVGMFKLAGIVGGHLA